MKKIGQEPVRSATERAEACFPREQGEEVSKGEAVREGEDVKDEIFYISKV